MGFWSGVWEVVKFTGKVGATAAAGATIIATGGVAAPLIGAGIYAGDKAVKEIAKDSDNEFFEKVGDFVEDVGLDGLTGGLFNIGTSTAASLAAREIARNGGRVTNGARVLTRVGQTIRIGGKAYTVYESTKEDIIYLSHLHHITHEGKGMSYDSLCPVCRGDI